jgi:threonyl-tRNA synthetase
MFFDIFFQRIYGISFPDPKQLKEWKALQEEAAKRDHRKIGREQGSIL